jgi:hypothetical protein
MVRTCDFIREVERAFGGDLPSCSRTVSMEQLSGWTELKEDIIVEWRKGHGLQWELFNQDLGGDAILPIPQEKYQ